MRRIVRFVSRLSFFVPVFCPCFLSLLFMGNLTPAFGLFETLAPFGTYFSKVALSARRRKALRGSCIERQWAVVRVPSFDKVEDERGTTKEEGCAFFLLFVRCGYARTM